jgi:hypothetical protein
MNNNHQSNHRNRNNRNNRHGKNKPNGQRNQRNENKDPRDKKVPMRYQVRKTKETSSVEFKYNVDGSVEKTKMNVYEDGNDEEYLKLIKEFQNYIDTYGIWDEENAARTIYRNFRRCLAGAARDLWDQVNVLEEDEERDELTFENHLKELTSTVLGEDALRYQKDYLKSTPKPEKMSVKQWINRIKNINSYLPLMQDNGRAFTEEELVSEVISKNIPSAWVKDFRMFKLHLKTRVKDVLTDLTMIEEQVKTHLKPTNSDKRQHLKNPCRIHNGGHEWDDCRQNPKNAKSDGKDKTTDRGRTDNQNNRNRENRRTEANGRAEANRRHTARSRSNSRSGESDDESYEYNCIVEKKSEQEKKEETPSSEVLIALPNDKGSKKYITYLGLIDSGSSGSLLSNSIIKDTKFNVERQKKPTKWDTATGVLLTKGKAVIEALSLPQFTKKRQVTSTFHLFEKRENDKYDIILGRDFLQAIGLVIDYSTSQFTWDNISITMVPSGYWTKEKIKSIAKTWNTPITEAVSELHLTEILPAEYKPTDINDVITNQTHLSPAERQKLGNVLLDFTELFKGQCGKYNGEPVSLELIPGSKPYYGKPFSIPKAYEQVTKDEIKRLESLGLLTQVASSEWAAPTFIIPKKNNTVRVITDFRGLNKCLVRKPYPIPKIPDIFRGMEKFKFATTIDLNMGYYSMPLDEEAKKLCVISLPWGLYRYEVLPQGIKPATDIFQQRMNALHYDLNDVDTFLDDIMALGYSTFDDHLAQITAVLTRLLAAGMQVNAGKCKWFHHSVTYLGFIITREGIKPQPEKIQGILNMRQPKTQREVRRFVGMINFYRDLYPKRAETLAPLTALCGQNKKFHWAAEHELAFNKITDQLAQETMLTYPQFDQPFVVYTDASEKQIGASSLRMESLLVSSAGN